MYMDPPNNVNPHMHMLAQRHMDGTISSANTHRCTWCIATLYVDIACDSAGPTYSVDVADGCGGKS